MKAATGSPGSFGFPGEPRVLVIDNVDQFINDNDDDDDNLLIDP